MFRQWRICTIRAKPSESGFRAARLADRIGCELNVGAEAGTCRTPDTARSIRYKVRRRERLDGAGDTRQRASGLVRFLHCRLTWKFPIEREQDGRVIGLTGLANRRHGHAALQLSLREM